MTRKCKVCGKRRKPPKQFNYVSRTMWEADEFCSAPCAKKFHGVEETRGHFSAYPHLETA